MGPRTNRVSQAGHVASGSRSAIAVNPVRPETTRDALDLEDGEDARVNPEGVEDTVTPSTDPEWIGKRVRLKNLLRKVELNGQMGLVIEKLNRDELWRIQLDTGAIVNATGDKFEIVDEVIEGEESFEDSSGPKVPDAPRNPTPKEVRAHRARGHAQYRSWCRSCVQGRKKDLPHR